MNSYKYKKAKKTNLKRYVVTDGEMLEQKVERIVTNKEPINDGAPVVYRDRNEGVNIATDIRADRFEIAIDAMDKVSKSRVAKRQDFLDKVDKVESTDTSEQVDNK